METLVENLESKCPDWKHKIKQALFQASEIIGKEATIKALSNNLNKGN